MICFFFFVFFFALGPECVDRLNTPIREIIGFSLWTNAEFVFIPLNTKSVGSNRIYNVECGS